MTLAVRHEVGWCAAGGPAWRRLSGPILMLLASLSIIIGVPQHVLDWDDDGGAPAAVLTLVHAASHGLIDHAAPGHACAAHCAAHALSDVPAPLMISDLIGRFLAWTGLAVRPAPSIEVVPAKPPPKA
jgi:hypothetical protein